MKKSTFCILHSAFCISMASAAIRFDAASAEIAMATNAPKSVAFAARELGGLLAQRLGATIPVVASPTPGKSTICLGDGPWAQEAGLDVNGLPRDAFFIRTRGSCVIVAGRDDPKYDPDYTYGCAGLWMQIFERGTLFGVYEFLERFAGIRMYFPGELGTVVPEGPFEAADCDLRVAPVFLDRSFTFCGPRWPNGGYRDTGYSRERMLLGYRLRMQTDYKPCVHGINALGLARRFKKEHPEWFVLNKDGSRGDTPCWSSGIVEEIYKDARGYLRGDDCTTRGFNGNRAFSRGWPYNCRSDRWVDLMPQDGMPKCHCEKCLAEAKAHPGSWATKPVWTAVASIGRRLKEEGIGGKVTCMAYWPYADIPDFPMPDNVEVMVAASGPWCMSRPGAEETDIAKARKWSEYLGRPVWLWTYSNKWGTRTFPDIPQFSMRPWGEYYKKARPWITGAFCEAESDRFIYNYLNFYVFSKVCWNTDLDIEALLAEHHRLMFGPAAADMAEFYDTLEQTFMEKVVGHYEESALGPMMVVPDEQKLWTEIYSPELRRRLDAMLSSAASQVAPESLEARRIAFFRKECFEPLDGRAARYLATASIPDGWSSTNLIEVRSADKGASKSFPLSGKAGSLLVLEPDTKYRLTFFLKTKDVKKNAKSWSGVVANVWAGYNIWLPANNWFTGTTPWTRHEYTFRTSKSAKAAGSYLRLALHNAQGEATFADVSLVAEKDAFDLLEPRMKSVNRRGPPVSPEVLEAVKVNRAQLWHVPQEVRKQGYEIDIDITNVVVTVTGSDGERNARAILDRLKSLAADGYPVPNSFVRDWPDASSDKQ